MTLTPAELHIVHQWFDAVQDVTPEYLGPIDYELAIRLYEQLGMRVPDSLRSPLNQGDR